MLSREPAAGAQMQQLQGPHPASTGRFRSEEEEEEEKETLQPPSTSSGTQGAGARHAPRGRGWRGYRGGRATPHMAPWPTRQVPQQLLGSCSEVAMPSPGTRPVPHCTRSPETYKAKCERWQEARESRRWRPNVTTCRLAENAMRARRREQLQGARQRLLLLRRRLDSPGGASGESSLREKLPGTSSRVPPTQQPPPTSVPRDLADPQPPKLHRGTQTLAEAAKPPSRRDVSQQTNFVVAVLDQEIALLSEYLKEALQRELVLKQKMLLLQEQLAMLVWSSHSHWTGLLNEDKLRGQLYALESQLHTCTQKAPPWGLKKALLEMEQQQSSYELKAKAALQKVLEEKMAAEKQLQSTQRSLAVSEQQCAEWRARCEALQRSQRELQDTAQPLQPEEKSVPLLQSDQ